MALFFQPAVLQYLQWNLDCCEFSVFFLPASFSSGASQRRIA
jgi:hypothetical protein